MCLRKGEEEEEVSKCKIGFADIACVGDCTIFPFTALEVLVLRIWVCAGVYGLYKVCECVQCHIEPYSARPGKLNKSGIFLADVMARAAARFISVIEKCNSESCLPACSLL